MTAGSAWTLDDTKARVRNSLRDTFPAMFGARWEEVAGPLAIVEPQRETLQMRKQVATQREYEALCNVSEGASEIVGEYAGAQGDEERRGACAIEDVQPAQMSGIQPCIQERHSCRFPR